MLLTTLMLIPLVGAIAVFLLPAEKASLAKQVALGFALATLVGSVFMLLGLDNSNGGLQHLESHDWIPAFGISWTLGVTGISASLIVMSAILVPVAIVAGWWDVEHSNQGSVKGYFSLILLLEVFIVGVFSANDLFLFYVFFEAILFPIYFLIGRFGGPQRA
jgi:NADH-quinone oxidoreductase subunit M